MMNAVSRKAGAAGLGLLVLAASAAAGEASKPSSRSAAAAVQSALSQSGESPESIVMRWPPRSRSAARLMLEKYGAPSQFDRDTMVWFNNGEWKRTIVYRRRVHNDPAVTRTDFLEQTIGYLVPNDKVAELKRFNSKLVASQVAGELTLASDSEERNRLALNLADEIVTGKRSTADARAFFLNISRLAGSGKSSPYLDGLLFDVDNTRFMTPMGADR